jgi:hypothetical protein
MTSVEFPVDDDVRALSDELRRALTHLNTLADAVVENSYNWEERELDTSSLTYAMFEAAANFITESFPPCPNGPPGDKVDKGWSADDPPRMVWSCKHKPRHCWDGIGNPTRC